MPKFVKVTRHIDEKDFLNRKKNEQNPRIRVRLLMIHNVSMGMSCNRVAKIFVVSKDTVSKWVRRFNEFGFEGLDDEARSGRPPKIDYDALKKALNSSPKDFGFPHEAWFPRIVYLYLFDFQNQKQMDPTYVYQVIKKAGFSLLIPKGRHYKSDPKKVEAFKKR